MKKFKDFINEKSSTAEVTEYEFDFGGNSFMVDVDVKGTVDYGNRDEAPEDWMSGKDTADIDSILISTLYVSVIDTYMEINPKGDPKGYKDITKKLEAYLMKDKKFISEAGDALYNS